MTLEQMVERARPHSLLWLTTYDRLASGLLILAALALGMFVVFILLRE